MSSRATVTGFENARWEAAPQKREFRHDAACALVRKGPVLDIGCGDGLLLSMLKECGIEGKGVDLSSQAVARAVARGLDAAVYDPHAPLPFTDGSFETVLLIDVLEHVYDPAALLAEAVRVSKQDVIISVPNFSSLPARVQTLLGKVPENNRPNKGHVYWFNYPILDHLTAEAGLKEDSLSMNTFRSAKLLPTRLIPNLLALSFVGRYCKQAPVRGKEGEVVN